MSNERNGDYTERDHGYGTSPDPTGVPIIEDFDGTGSNAPVVCPNCKAERLFSVAVAVEAPPMLRVPDGSEAISHYIGCAACPWASPAMISARPKKETS